MWVQVPFLAPAGMAELVDALDSGSSEGSFMKVQVLLPAPNSRNPNLMPIGDGFGFLFVLNLRRTLGVPFVHIIPPTNRYVCTASLL